MLDFILRATGNCLRILSRKANMIRFVFWKGHSSSSVGNGFLGGTRMNTGRPFGNYCRYWVGDDGSLQQDGLEEMRHGDIQVDSRDLYKSYIIKTKIARILKSWLKSWYYPAREAKSPTYLTASILKSVIPLTGQPCRVSKPSSFHPIPLGISSWPEKLQY